MSETDFYRGAPHISDEDFVVTTTPGESPLCSICRKVLNLLSNTNHVSCNIPVERRAKKGCHLCALFTYRLQDPRYRIEEEWAPKSRVTRKLLYRVFPIALHLSQSNTGDIMAQDEQNPWTGLWTQVSILDWEGPYPDIPAQPSADFVEHTVKTAKAWLQRCVAGHQSCQVQDGTFLPTRLIDVGLQIPPVPSLCLGKSVTSPAQYATLSHCWGERGVSVKLTLDSLHSMLQSMDFDLLPKTFQDAIRVTQKLGLRYIWIDSLCIIQDSVDDWQKESAAMSQVYSNGSINISANVAKNSTEGLFYNRNSTAIGPVYVQTTLNGKDTKAVFCSPEIWSDGVEDTPLNLRGWVVQERLLSKHSLCFSHEQVFWECCENIACEMFAEAIPQSMLSGQISSLKSFFTLFANDFAGQTDLLPDLDLVWGIVVENYTKCHLSKPNDKLVALGGIASRIRDLYGSQYLAGLWRSHLVRQLCWRNMTQNPLYSGPLYSEPGDSYIAPSWSWASCSYPINNPHPGKLGVEVCEVVEVNVDLVSTNPFGQVSAGFLTLKTCIAAAIVNGYRHLQLGLDREMIPEREADIKYYWDSLNIARQLDNGSAFYLLPMLEVVRGDLSISQSRVSDLNRPDYMRGIVVKHIPGTVPPVFQRIGAFYIRDEIEASLFRTACESSGKIAMERGLDLESSKSATGSTQYIVTIL